MENGEHGRSGKKPRAAAHAVVVKQDVEEGEVLYRAKEVRGSLR